MFKLKSKLIQWVAVILAITVFAPAAVLAAASDWFETEHGSVRLIAATEATGDREQIALGLHFRMKPGWKIYWRSPGDAGFPPSVNWAGSENLAKAEMRWPAPERFEVLGLQTLGYHDQVILPISASVFEPGKPLNVAARLAWLTCDDICVPYEARLALNLPSGPETTTRNAGLIQSYQAKVPPAAGENTPLRIASADVAASGAGPILIVEATAATPFAKPDLYVEGPEALGFGAPAVALSEENKRALMRIAVAVPKGDPTELAGREVTLTLVDGDRAVEHKIALGRAQAVPGEAGDALGGEIGYTLWAILGFALLGGLILNLMPCVLPVLSIKLLSAVSHGGGESREVRRGFLASAAGILASFLVLATAALLLREAGQAVGWGIQFQEPLFLVPMIIILVLFGANLLGLFEIRLPGAVSDVAATAGGHDTSIRSHFLTGVFATLLATPCSAPFLGTAVGFALSRGAGEIYAVFAALGIGLALPYFAVAAMPKIATALPKPGPWMNTLKKVLSIALFLTALWLLSVLAIQIGIPAAAMVGAMMVAIVVAVWQLRGLSGKGRFATWIVVAGVCVLSLGGTAAFRSIAADEAAVASSDSLWRPFDPVAIGREVALGRTVLVDVTADWCITCQVNKKLVLDREPVRSRLASGEVVLMRADWTKPDPKIAAYLKSYGRFGIPFNVVYGPGSPKGEPLPELLTADAVLSTLDQAATISRNTAQR